MKSDLFDKLLIVLMVILLPVSIFIASTLKDSSDIAAGNQSTDESQQRIDQALEQLQNAAKPAQAVQVPPITIQSISFASKSGELRVTGEAPGKNLNVMVSAVITPPKTLHKPSTELDITESASDSASLGESVLGESVDMVAVKTSSDGSFTFIKKIDTKKADLIELKLDQGESTATVQYNLLENRRTL
jgi:hypothetical protein